MIEHCAADRRSVGTPRRLLLAIAVILMPIAESPAVASDTDVQHLPTLQAVRDRGMLRCGVNPDLQGFSRANSLGEYSGLDIDFCRAVAAAVTGDADAIDIHPVTTQQRFTGLINRQFDLLARNTTWTLEREALYGDFVGVQFYDGQGFMVTRRSGIQSAFELDNASVCVARGTTTEHNAVEFFALSDMRYRPIHRPTSREAVQAFERGDCEALTMDRSGLAAARSTFAEPLAYRVLPEVISKEPLGPMVNRGDPVWTRIVRWTLNCMISAEELGISQSRLMADNVDDAPAVRRLLGKEGNLGALLELEQDWCARVIRQVGNYADSYERHVGQGTVLGLERGVNALWTDGGLLYAPPMR